MVQKKLNNKEGSGDRELNTKACIGLQQSAGRLWSMEIFKFCCKQCIKVVYKKWWIHVIDIIKNCSCPATDSWTGPPSSGIRIRPIGFGSLFGRSNTYLFIYLLFKTTATKPLFNLVHTSTWFVFQIQLFDCNIKMTRDVPYKWPSLEPKVHLVIGNWN